MKRFLLLALLPLAFACAPKRLTVLSTNDVHGAWFDSSYAGSGAKPSLLAVNYYVDSIRRAEGRRNVLLLDAGDCLQGDHAAYYYNYVDTASEHLFSRIASYMKYDAICLGNHDIETGHAVYDRVASELASRGIPFMSGNAIRTSDSMPYFPLYKVFRRGGFKVLVLGYNNPNIAAWLDESLWRGMRFESLVPLVQKDVDRLGEIIKPDVVIACVHSGTGKGDGSILEDQALDLFRSLRGVDLILGGHDHRPLAKGEDSIALINAGSKARYIGLSRIEAQKGKKKISAELLKVDADKADSAMRRAFSADYEKVKAFTNKEIGVLTTDLRTREAYSGMCPYLNLLHSVQLRYSGADISFAAPLTYDGTIRAGVLTYNDLFTIYPFENTLVSIKLRGCEIKAYLEYSYSLMLGPAGSPHALALDGRSFANPSYNFDSAAGLRYIVDLSRPAGFRVKIISLADGSPFDMQAEYSVAMTSYRANGGGDLLTKGAGIPKEELQGRINGRFPEIRECLKSYIQENAALDPALFSGSELGEWKFVSKEKALQADLRLLFGEGTKNRP